MNCFVNFIRCIKQDNFSKTKTNFANQIKMLYRDVSASFIAQKSFLLLYGLKIMKSLFATVFFGFLLFLASTAQTAGSTNQKPVSGDSLHVKPTDTVKQVDLVDYLVKWFKIKNSQQKRDNQKIRFTLFPTQSGAGGGKTVITSFNASFLLGDISNTNVSTVLFVPYISFDKRFGFQLQPNIWLRKNSWNFTGEYFFLNYPQETWGLGGASPDEYETMIDYNQTRIHQNALKGILPHLAVGLGYAYDRHYNIAVEENEYQEMFEAYFPADVDHTTSSGITIPAIYDSRHNSNNPQQGLMASATYSFYLQALGSDSDWQSLFLDVRKYFPFAGKRSQILAFRSFYWTIINGHAPYLDLPANRWEPALGSSSRGIQQNRYRSNALIDFETEYRFGITANGLFGGVVFASVTSASEYGTQQFKYLHPAAGAGLRLKFNKYSRVNVTLDFGFSKGYQALYVNIGEVF